MDTDHIIFEDKNGEKTIYCLYPETCKVCAKHESCTSEKCNVGGKL
jgi:hypothetical protein